jgi:hypothetical protein
VTINNSEDAVAIGNNAFYQNTSLINLFCQAEDIAIGKAAFAFCNLTDISLQTDGDLTLGDFSFFENKLLCEIKKLGNAAVSNISIGKYAFSQCQNLRQIDNWN